MFKFEVTKSKKENHCCINIKHNIARINNCTDQVPQRNRGPLFCSENFDLNREPWPTGHISITMNRKQYW